jgi:hypothetical protein
VWGPGTPASTSIPEDPLNQSTSSNFKPKVLLREVITAPEVANYLVISYPGRPTSHKTLLPGPSQITSPWKANPRNREQGSGFRSPPTLLPGSKSLLKQHRFSSSKQLRHFLINPACLLFITASRPLEQAQQAIKRPKKYRLGPVPVVRLCSTIETHKNNQTIHCLRIPHDGQE